MCLSSPKAPEVPPPPPPAPAPTPTETAPQATADQRRKKIESLKYGMMSTIKTGPQGITGAGPDLANTAAGGKKTLGA